MISTVLTWLFGSHSQRTLNRYQKTVNIINALEPDIKKLCDVDLKAKTADFISRLSKDESLDSLLPEAFAVCREASLRSLKMRHFDCQMMGGIALHEGKIAEMSTGEGKTLVATLAAYLNALSGKGVHIVTVNDYLAKRDAAWMGKLYNFLGLEVGVNYSGLGIEEKRDVYLADVTYGTNHEFGFDYLKDNMVHDSSERVLRKLNYAIVDEVDSILIDEARTPLIISGPEESGIKKLYVILKDIVDQLTPTIKNEEELGHYIVDFKDQQAMITDAGLEHIEQIMVERGLLNNDANLYDTEYINLVYHLYAAIRAKELRIANKDYVVQNGQIVIVDEFTGRLMPGRRWSDGLHQAVEAKEGLNINEENRTLASITYQNYFRLYNKLSGMTGTACTESVEFSNIYNLDCLAIPSNRLIIRKDYLDRIYSSTEEKIKAIVLDIKDAYDRGQPVLVGTTSIENSELLSANLKIANLAHQVLNAKNHESEAFIIAQAGKKHMITIATNMAGRGTDIVLGGNLERIIADTDKPESEVIKLWQEEHDEVVSLGGLYVLGTERHESRRIDNQLRGRSGRQGDPGCSRFFLSMEDPLLKIFAGDTMVALMNKLNIPADEAIENSMVNRAIESAQGRVESRNFEIRKQLLDYDDVSNEHRKWVYDQRNEWLDTDDISTIVSDIYGSTITKLVLKYVPTDSMQIQWNIEKLDQELQSLFGILIPFKEIVVDALNYDDLLKIVLRYADKKYRSIFIENDVESIRLKLELEFLLKILDKHWCSHLVSLEHLRQGIYLRGYAAKNPKQEYKKEAFALFELMLDEVSKELTNILFNLQLLQPKDSGITDNTYTGIPRNNKCPCGSGKKFKLCHGRLKSFDIV